jgi:2-polyprenyl-6-methoxyphenol hydroxylase-like FAD-dependent oxidoreductase
LAAFEQQYGVPALTIHRAQLHQTLLEQLQHTPIYLGKRLKSCQQQEHGAVLRWQDGSETTAEIVVGADGIHSQLRQLLFPAVRQRSAGQWCWRGVLEHPLEAINGTALYEAWGKGCRFGIVPLQGKQLYWFACVNGEGEAIQALDRAGILAVFKDFHPFVHKLIKNTPSKQIIGNPLCDLPNNLQWHQNNCCLLGDAAHAPTPNMGQGANQAIESAWVLADRLSDEKTPQAAFAAYQDLRQAKAQKIIQTSWQIGKLAQIENPLLIGLRNALLALTPTRVTAQKINQLYQLTY